MEIKYAPALQEQKPITFNFEEIKAELTTSLEKYKNLVVTEDGIKEAKDTKAKLNKFREGIESERKRIKNQCMEPYNAFEKQIKELVAMIEEPVKAIDTQIKTFEEKELSLKQDEIGKIYKANIGVLEAIIPIGKIYNPQWENKTYSLKKIEKEMIAAIEKINSDLRVISGFKSEFETELRTTYLDTFNLEVVLNKKQKLEDQKKFVEEQKQQQAQVQEEEKEIVEEVQQPEPVKETLHVVEPVQEKTYVKKIWVEGTKDQLTTFSQFLKTNNIKYGAIVEDALAS